MDFGKFLLGLQEPSWFPRLFFSLSALRYLAHPVASAASRGITLSPGLGITIGRVGQGGFSLPAATFLPVCLVSRRRLLIGLIFVAIMVGVLLLVRVCGMYTDGSPEQNMKFVRG
jgi:hypothetical protein